VTTSEGAAGEGAGGVAGETASVASGHGASGTAGEGSSLVVAPLLALERPLARRVVRLFLLERCGLRRDLERAHVEALLDWLPQSRSGSSLELPRGWRIGREFDRLRLLPPPRDPNLTPGGSCHILVLAHRPDRDPPLPTGPAPIWTVTMPAAALQGEPRLRPWRDGDRLRPPGLAGHKKVSDLLRERRVPRSRRPGILVIEDDGGLLAVVGLAHDERTRLLPGCERAVTLAVASGGLSAADEPKGRSEP
jgi:tRNA(Ile)-lysidine synthase